MIARDLTPDEVEGDRRRRMAERAAESGPDWDKAFRPGSHGRHELLDRTALQAAAVERDLLSHPACVANPDWYRLPGQAAAALRELYQRVGAMHLGADE